MNPLTSFAQANSPHISIAAEPIFHIGPVPITNSMLLGVFGFIFLVWAFMHASKSIQTKSRKTWLDKLLIWGFSALYNSVLDIIPDRKMARVVAPIPIAMFFLIITQYYFGLLPIVGPITVNGTPMFRGLAADLNFTFALAIVTIIGGQLYAMKTHGFFGNIGRYLRNPIKDPAGAFEGILELIAEFSRLVGLSFRLFGNVFAGEVLLVIIAFLSQYAAVIALPPFYIFELFIGMIQAYIFFMLTTVFISLGLVSHNHDHSENHDHSANDEPKINILDSDYGVKSVR